MEPIPFPQSNKTFRGQPGSDVSELPVYRCADENGTYLISKWKATTAEIDEINRTGVVWLWTRGEGTAPVFVTAKDPFKEEVASDKPT